MIENIKLKANVSFSPANINVLVGPNNSGKSTFLNDIKGELIEPRNQYQKIVIEEIKVHDFQDEDVHEFFEKFGKSEIKQLNQRTQVAQQGFRYFKMGNSTNYAEYNENTIKQFLINPNKIQRYELVESQTTKMLDGQSRLGGFYPQTFSFINNSDDMELSNVAKLANSEILMAEFKEYVFEALGLYPEILSLNNGNAEISLLKSPLPTEQKKSYEPAVIESLMKGVRGENTSDGIRAFMGILIELIAGNPSILLIDEVEAFLHPPLARKLGEIISKVAKQKDKQVFVTTHNPNFIMGCIESGAGFNILRLSFDGEKGKAKLIEEDELKSVILNPLLRSTGIFEGLFYKNVFVCEADSDRVFYQEVNRRLLEQKDSRGIEDCLFVNARNKQTVGEITKLLRKFDIPTVSVIDFDFIKDGGVVFTKYLEQNNIPEPIHEGIRTSKHTLNEYFKTSDSDFSKKNSKLKMEGILFLDNGNKALAEQFLSNLNQYGLFPVPVGEVERWLPHLEASGHGDPWLISKFELMGFSEEKDYCKPDSGDVWDFIGAINEWLKNSNRKGMQV